MRLLLPFIFAINLILLNSFLAQADEINGAETSSKHAIQELLLAANNGDSDAMLNIGELYSRGSGIPQDWEVAASWFKKAADAGHPEGMLKLSDCYRYGNGVALNKVTAFGYINAAAKAGYARGIFRLGKAHDVGMGTPKNPKLAVEIYKEAVTKGSTDAMLQLGYVYQTGSNEQERDYKVSLKYFSMAAEGHNGQAMSEMGNVYRNGFGVAPDDKEAAKWYLLAARQNDPVGMMKYGQAALSGQGMDQNDEQAFAWLSKAAGPNDGASQRTAASFYLGICFEEGRGTKIDIERAFRCFLNAAKIGHPPAMVKTGLMYLEGKGVLKSAKEGIKWIEKAADMGDEKAHELLLKIKSDT